MGSTPTSSARKNDQYEYWSQKACRNAGFLIFGDGFLISVFVDKSGGFYSKKGLEPSQNKYYRKHAKAGNPDRKRSDSRPFLRFRRKGRTEKKMARYFLQDTPLAGLERMMMQTPRPAGSAGEEAGGGKAKQNPARRRQRHNRTQTWRSGDDAAGESARPAPAEIRR